MQRGGGADPAAAANANSSSKPVVQAVEQLKRTIFSVSLVDWLARWIFGHSKPKRGERPSLLRRLLSVAVIALLPLLFDTLLRVFNRESHYPVIAWLGGYAASADYLMGI